MRDTWLTVGTDQTQPSNMIIAPGSGNENVRAEAMIYNAGPTTVWLGNRTANLGVSTGFPLAAGATVTIALANDGLYARVTTGTQVINALVIGTST